MEKMSIVNLQITKFSATWISKLHQRCIIKRDVSHGVA